MSLMANEAVDGAADTPPPGLLGVTPDPLPARAVGPVSTSDPAALGGRRPIEPWEVPHLRRLGVLLKQLRLAAGLTQVEVARLADLSERFVRRLERGERRTRASTLARLAEALRDGSQADLVAPDLLLVLLDAAGPALAPESEYADRVLDRRRRRVDGARRRYAVRHITIANPVVGGTVLVHVHSVRRGRSSIRMRVYRRLVTADGRVLRLPLG